MSVLKVARLGRPVLRGVARPVPPEELASEEMQRLIRDMVETMHDYDGVGWAAPQVHVPLRVIVFEVSSGTRRPGVAAVPRTVLANPSYTPVDEAQDEGWEGCLSIPDLRGLVPRFRCIRVRGQDEAGRTVEFEAEGFHARVIQHECDHVDGRVYLDRMHSFGSLGYLAELHRYVLTAPSGSLSLRTTGGS